MIECLPLFSRKLYNFNSTTLGLFFSSRFLHRTSWDFLFFNKETSYCLTDTSYNLVKAFVVRNIEQRPWAFFYGFSWIRFVLFSGLGYKRRFSKKYRIMFAYTGDRHWILYKFSPRSFVVPVRRRNFIFFSNSKGKFVRDYSFFSFLRKGPVYKMKGFLDTRVRGRFLFVRRIKIRGIRTKLSKKQQLL